MPPIDQIELLYRRALIRYVEDVVQEELGRLRTATPETHLAILQTIIEQTKPTHSADRQRRTIERVIFDTLDL